MTHLIRDDSRRANDCSRADSSTGESRPIAAGVTRRAFLAPDVLVALGIVAVLAVSVIAIVGRAGRMAGAMSNSRTASRAAEAALADLQARRALDVPAGVSIGVRAEPGGAAVPGYAWARVSATSSGQSAELVGLVPDSPQLHQAQSSARPKTREAP